MTQPNPITVTSPPASVHAEYTFPEVELAALKKSVHELRDKVEAQERRLHALEEPEPTRDDPEEDLNVA